MLSMNFFVNVIGFLPLTDLALLLFKADYSSKRAILLKSQQKVVTESGTFDKTASKNEEHFYHYATLIRVGYSNLG